VELAVQNGPSLSFLVIKPILFLYIILAYKIFYCHISIAAKKCEDRFSPKKINNALLYFVDKSNTIIESKEKNVFHDF